MTFNKDGVKELNKESTDNQSEIDCLPLSRVADKFKMLRILPSSFLLYKIETKQVFWVNIEVRSGDSLRR